MLRQGSGRVGGLCDFVCWAPSYVYSVLKNIFIFHKNDIYVNIVLK